MEFLLLLSVASLVTVFVGTAVYFIMTLGTKEKTYDEAIKEQRQRSEADALLGRNAKEKQKERKLKKVGKKVKEKAAASKEASNTVSGNQVEPNSQTHKNQHVAFVTEAAIIEEPVAVVSQEKKKKKDIKTKPILVNKDDGQVIKEVNPPPLEINHFEQIHPKDDLEMRRHSKDESIDRAGKKSAQKLIEAEKLAKAGKKEKENVAPKPEKQPAPKTEKVEKQSATKSEKPVIVAAVAKVEKPVVKEVVEKQEKPVAKVEKIVQQEAPVFHAPVTASAPSKSNKKKKIEMTLEQMTSGRDGINANLLEPLIHKAELSRSEIQNLIDILLNKQQGSEAENAEWIEGRQDPMMKLKKAFAEKEKALQEEQEATLGIQNKLKEVRAEANAERSRLNASVRQLEEKLNARNTELTALSAKFQHEKQGFAQQIQQLKLQVEQDHQLIRKFQEEHGQAQNALQTRQQLEHHIAALNAQLQEQEAALTQQISVLQQQVAENQNAAQQCELLSTQVSQLQEQLKNAQNSNLGEVHSKQKQLNESKAAKEEIERQLSVARQRESQLNSELSKLKESAAQRQAELDKLASEAAEAMKLREENQLLNSQVSLVSKLEMETRQLREENEFLAAQVTAVTERPAAEGRENGDMAEEKQADAKLASAQLINDLREKDSQVEELLEKVKQAEKSASTTIDSLKSEINAHKNEVAKLSKELDQQRKKNDELRNKNYKVMEALDSSEKMVQSKIQEREKLVHEAEETVRLGEQKKVQEVLQRLFPAITVEEKVHDQWIQKFSAAASEYVTELSTRQSQKQTSDEDQSAVIADLEKRNTQLSSMVTNYKSIIDDTEGILKKLQQYVEAAETKWQQQLADKEVELAAAIREKDELQSRLSGDQSSGAQSQLAELQKKLQSVEAEKSNLQSQLASGKDTLAKIDQLKDEKNRLSSELAAEQAKALDQSNQLEKLKTRLGESEDAVAKERITSQQLREEIDKLKKTDIIVPTSPVSTTQNVNGATNGPSSSDVPVEKAASTKKKNLSGWLKKKVGGSKSPQLSPNLSARGDDFLANERMESS